MYSELMESVTNLDIFTGSLSDFISNLGISSVLLAIYLMKKKVLKFKSSSAQIE